MGQGDGAFDFLAEEERASNHAKGRLDPGFNEQQMAVLDDTEVLVGQRDSEINNIGQWRVPLWRSEFCARTFPPRHRPFYNWKQHKIFPAIFLYSRSMKFVSRVDDSVLSSLDFSFFSVFFFQFWSTVRTQTRDFIGHLG